MFRKHLLLVPLVFAAALAAFVGVGVGTEVSLQTRRLEQMKKEYFAAQRNPGDGYTARDCVRMEEFLERWSETIDARRLSSSDRRDFLVMLHRVKAALEWQRLTARYGGRDEDDDEGRQPSREEVFAYRFKYQFGIDTTPLRAARRAQKEWDDTWSRLEAIARAWQNKCIAGLGLPSLESAGLSGVPADWRRLDELVKRDCLSGDDLLEHARDSLQEARDFVVERDLVSLPTYATYVSVRWGSRGRSSRSVPFGYYLPDFSQDKSNTYHGYYVVTPLDKSLSDRQQEEFLRGNNVHWTRVVALHEAIPGHHLQFAVAARKASRVQRDCYNPAFVEGWALYCEGMMARNGYFADCKDRLTQQKMRLWRCARVLIDLGIHIGGMSKKEAERLLVEKVGLEPFAAKREVARYAEVPFYQSAYLLGCLEIESMRRSLEKSYGEAFDQKNFHDEVLGCAPIPMDIVREYVLSEARGK